MLTLTEQRRRYRALLDALHDLERLTRAYARDLDEERYPERVPPEYCAGLVSTCSRAVETVREAADAFTAAVRP